jgi:hypothetical protein
MYFIRPYYENISPTMIDCSLDEWIPNSATPLKPKENGRWNEYYHMRVQVPIPSLKLNGNPGILHGYRIIKLLIFKR